MRISGYRHAFGICGAVAMLAGCGGSPPPIGAQRAMPFSTAHTQSTPARNAGQGKSTAEFAYVVNEYSNNISAYAINASTGALTQVQGSPFATGYGAYAVAIDPTGRFAYVANSGTGSSKNLGNVSAFAINERSGALTPVQGSPFAADSRPVGVVISPNGKFAYVDNYSSTNVSIFAVNGSTGALKQVKGSPYRTRPLPSAEAIDPTGKFIYVTNVGYKADQHPGHITGYTIDARSGALREPKGSHKQTGIVPVSAAIGPAGKFVYVANYLSETVSAYAIAARTGALREVQGSPFSAGYNPGAVAVAPSGSFVYVAFDGGVAGYTIGPSGALTPVQGSPFAAGYEPDGIAVDPLGKFVYVSNTGEYGKVSAYTINPSNGALTQVQGSPFAAGTHPVGIATCEVKHDRCVPPTL
jgi:6-phosphogluconolactonase